MKVSFASWIVGAILALTLAYQSSIAAVSPFYPGHVQACQANLDDSGQGVAFEALINVTEDQAGKRTCELAVYYGFEYGSESGFRGMFNVFPRPSGGATCTVDLKDGKSVINVTKGRKHLVENCEIRLGGDKR